MSFLTDLAVTEGFVNNGDGFRLWCEQRGICQELGRLIHVGKMATFGKWMFEIEV